MKWFLNRKISTKILIGFLIVALIAGGVGINGIIMVSNLIDKSSSMLTDNLGAIDHLGNLTARFYEQEYLTSKILAESADNPELIPDDLTAIKASDTSMMDSLNYLSGSTTAETADMMANTTAQIEEYRSYIAALTQAYEAGDMDAAVDVMVKNNALGDGNVIIKTKAAIEENEAFNKNVMNAMLADTEKSSRGRMLTMNITVLMSVVIAVFLGLLISKVISKPIKYLVAQVERVGEGDLNIKESNYDVKDETGKLVRVFRNVLKSVKALAADVNMLTEAATNGQLSIRADASQHKGDFAKIVDGINNTLDAVIEPVTEATGVLSELSMGNLNVKVTGDYKGDHAVIKEALNNTLDTLKGYIGEISSVLGAMSVGDLTLAITEEYKGNFVELKTSINTIISSLNGIVSEISTAAEQVAVGTKQVSDGSQEISQGATEQACAIEQLTSAMVQIAEQTRQNAMSAGQANELTALAKTGAAEGNEQMQEMQRAMAEINESSENISKIIKVIDDIAFQTNILALNAAVEAARAGVHGKGFAVVAEEVRNLAARSANAAKETTVLIEGSIKKTQAGTEIADKTAKALASIVEGIEKAAELTARIAVASDEQAAGIAQVNDGIEQMSQVVQTNSATSEETAASSEELSSQAEMLEQMVAQFKLKSADEKEMPKAMQISEESVRTIGHSSGDAKPAILLGNEFGKY